MLALRVFPEDIFLLYKSDDVKLHCVHLEAGISEQIDWLGLFL